MKIDELMDMMNYNLSREGGKSMIGEIQKQIIDLYFKNPNLDTNSLDSFGANIYSNPNIFSGKNIDYSGIKDVNDYFNVKKQEFLKTKQLDSGKSL